MTTQANTVMQDLTLALCNAQEVIHLTYCVVGTVGGDKTCAKECREAQEALAEAKEILPTAATVSASVRYSRKLGDGSHKTVELSAEVALMANENWQEIQSKLYGDLCLQLKTLWATRNNVAAQELEARTAPKLP
ncbi:MAG: hypothetical protein IIC24_05500 [Chloroflexi bacterium]|nr:hypothetical protein [Chloroflexota bacterium]